MILIAAQVYLSPFAMKMIKPTVIWYYEFRTLSFNKTINLIDAWERETETQRNKYIIKYKALSDYYGRYMSNAVTHNLTTYILF